MKGKASWLKILVVAIVCLLGMTAVACNGSEGGDGGNTDAPLDSPAIGVYYNDASGSEWLLSLNDDRTVALNIGNDVIGGTFEIDGGSITLSVSSNAVASSATYANDAVTVKYNGADVKFLRRVDYTVKFDAGSGSPVADVKVRNGKNLVKPADPTYNGHAFIGWYKDNAYTTAFNFGAEVITADVTLYARWVEKAERDEYTVEFDLGYGEDSEYATVTTINGLVYNVEDPSRAGYTFAGWWTKTDAAYSQRVDISKYEFEEDTVLYALWQSAPEGSKLPAPIVNIESGKITWNSIANASSYHVKVTDPDGDVHEYDEEGSTVNYTFDEVGKYVVEVYAISLTGAANNSDVTVREYVNGKLARVSALSHNGDVLTFSKVENATEYWIYFECGDPQHKHNPYNNGNSSEYNFGDCVMVEGGLKFTVEARAEGYISSMSNMYTVDRTLDEVSGFSYDASAQMVSWDAVQNATSYTVTVTCSDNAHVVTQTVKSGTSVSVRECAKGDITVTVVADNPKYNSSEAAAYKCSKAESKAPANLTLDNMTLSWQDLGADKYTVDVNGTTIDVTTNTLDLATTEINWTVGTAYDIKVCAVKGSDVSSWSATVGGVYRALSGVEYDDGTVSWKPVIGASGATVTVNGGAAVTAEANSAKVKLTARVNVIQVTLGGVDTTVTKMITVNAHEIAFNANGSNDQVSAAYYANGDTLDFADVERNGYDFRGWYSSATGNGKHYVNGTAFTLDADITLYARWEGKWYDVTLNYNRTGDDTDETKVVKVQYGEEFEFGVPTVPKSTIHGFMQWNMSRDGKGIALTGTEGIGNNVWLYSTNVTVYAKWQTIFEFVKVDSGSAITYTVRQGEAANMVSEIVIPAEYKADDDDVAYPITVIGGNAFNFCRSLTKITIPATIETIEPTAFNYCDSLTDIVIDGGRPGLDRYWSVDGVVYGKNNTTERAEIAYYPLGRRGDFTIDTSVTDIGYQSLKGAHIDTLYIPYTVTRISNNAFESSYINEIVFSEPPAGTQAQALNILASAFASATNVTSITLPSRDFAFIDETGEVLTDIDFKAEVFASCRSLATINVAEGNADYLSVDGMLCVRADNGSDVTVIFCPVGYVFENGVYTTSPRISIIGDKTFSGLQNLREVVIGPSISHIGDHAFSGYSTQIGTRTVYVSACASLSKLTIKGGRGNAGITIGNAAFGTENDSATIYAGSSLYRMACDSLNTIIFEDGSNVTEIGDYAFSFSRIYSFALPDTLTSIGTGAFKGCSQLTRVEFADSDSDFTFGEDVFMNCSRLERVVLPKNITEFKGGVFAGCSSLRIIEVDPDNPVLTFIDGILYGKDAETGKVTSIHFIPVGVDMTNYTMPDGITEINAGVFGNAGNTIKELTISKYVTYIGANAFANTGIERVVFLDKADDDDDEGADTLLIVGATSASTGAFYNCTSLKEVVLPARLKTIPAGMFSRCTALTSFDLTSVTEIGRWAFYYAGLSGELVIPKNIESIGASAFEHCTSITKVTFEDDREKPLYILNTNGETDGLNNNNDFVAARDAYTFYYCTGITEVHLPEKLMNIGGNMFYYNNKLTTINIPASVKSIRYNSFSSCSALANMTFAERPDANELYLEEGATISGSGAPSYYGVFKDIKVKNMVFPKGLVRIPMNCFYNNTTIQSVYVPNTVRNVVNEKGKAGMCAIGSSAFSGCSNLTSIEFEEDNPDDLANPNYLGFSIYGTLTASKLTSITLPARISSYWQTATATTKTDALNAFTATTSALKTINIMPGSSLFSSVDGVVYNADKTELLLCPRGMTDAFTVPYYVTSIGASAFSSSKITGLSFEAKPAEEVAAEGEEEVNDDLVIGTSAFSSCTGLTGVLTLPERLTTIGTSAFNGCNKITAIAFAENGRLSVIGDSAFFACTELGALNGTLTIPASVTKIGEKAFSASSGLTQIKTLNFASNETSQLDEIGSNAFEKIGISVVYLPDSVTTLGNNVFANSANITTASIPLTVNNFNGTFLNCGNLTSLSFREVEGKPSALDKTDDGAVYSQDGKVLYYYPQDGVPNAGKENEGELVIKPGVEEIAPTTFAYNPNIKKVTIPNTVTKIGTQAFYMMVGLEEVVFEDDTTETAATSLVFEEATSGSGRTFAGCANLTKINFPSRLTTMCKEAFNYCTSLSDISFADNIKLIALPNYAFQYAGDLGDVELPEGLGRLGQYTFRYSGIRSVVIPASYEYNSSDSYTFADCPNLTTVEFKTPTTARKTIQTSSSMFLNCTALKNVTLAGDMQQVYSNSFQGCTALEEITLPGSITTIGTSAFSGCVNLKYVNRKEGDAEGTVNIPAGVTSIGSTAFLNCSSIKYINLMDTTGTLSLSGAGAFAGTGITEITIPKNVSAVSTLFYSGSGATLVMCDELETVIFEAGNISLTAIPASMFKDMKNLKNVTLPKDQGSKTLKINNNAFAGSGITSIEIPHQTTDILYSAFADCKDLASVTFEKDANGKCSLLWIGNYSFQNSGLTSIVIPKSAQFKSAATSYATSIFNGCKELTSVTFEEGSVLTLFQNETTTTATSDFAGCVKLSTIVLPDGLQVIHNGLFSELTALESITIPSTVRKIGNNAFNGCTKLATINMENTNVTEIGEYAFAYTAITSFVVPAMVSTVSNYAFYKCASLESLTYAGEYVRTIGTQAFDGCTVLAEAIIPASVESIGNLAYQSCNAITEVTLPVALKTLGTNPFINCSALTTVNAPAYGEEDVVRFVVENGAIYNADKTTLYLFFDRSATSFTLPEETTNIAADAFWFMPIQTFIATQEGLVIGASAFRGSALQSVTLGANVEINDYAFAYCNSLTSFTVPDGANVYLGAFYGSAIEELTFDGDVYYEGYVASFGQDATITINGKNGKIENSAFYNDVSLTKVIIAEGVTEIGTNAFYGTSNLASISLPSTLTKIGNYAFRYSGLTSITIPGNVTDMGAYTFVDSSKLETITLEEGIKTIGTYAFAGTVITSITIPASVTSFGTSPFYWSSATNRTCDTLETVIFADGSPLTELPQYAFRYLTALNEVKLPAGLKVLGQGTSSGESFVGTQITSITIPKTVTKIYSSAFNGVSTLGEVIFERDDNGNCALTSIAGNAFKGTSLSGTLSIPATVTNIDANAFNGCTGITAIEFERNAAGKCAITTIGAGAFAGTSITEISLPETLVTLGSTSTSDVGVFEGCNQLASITFMYDDNDKCAFTTLGTNTFKGTVIEEIVLPATATKVYAAFADCDTLRKVTLPTNMATVGTNLFTGLTSLEEVIIPEGNTTVGTSMFEGCTGIKTLVLPSTITTINEKAFKGWTDEQTVRLTGIKSPGTGYNIGWAMGCNANMVWNYSAPEVTE